MSNQNLRKWLDAAKILGEDANRKVLCPNCNVGYLYVKDVIWKDGKKCDRYIICPNCNAYNTITFFID
jgi:hypothetical protein